MKEIFLTRKVGVILQPCGGAEIFPASPASPASPSLNIT
jgi:hypothetical protein